MNNSAALSQFAVNLKYEDIPAEVIEMAKKMAIQTIGAALASKEMDFTQSVLDFFQKVQQRSGRCHFDARRQKNLSIGCCICKTVSSPIILTGKTAVGPVILLPALFLRRWHWPRREGNPAKTF